MMTEEKDSRVISSLLAGNKLCDHEPGPRTHRVVWTDIFVAACPRCLLQGPIGKSHEEARELFWKQNAIDRGRYLTLLTSGTESLGILPTRKTTKWVIVNKGDGPGYESYVYRGRLYDNETAARTTVEKMLGTEKIVGVFPLEIELPL
jgi:hypothetical protein